MLMTHPKRGEASGGQAAAQIDSAISESRMIRSDDIDVIAAVDAKELRGSVVKDGNMNTVAYCYAAEVARWRAKRLSESETESRNE